MSLDPPNPRVIHPSALNFHCDCTTPQEEPFGINSDQHNKSSDIQTDPILSEIFDPESSLIHQNLFLWRMYLYFYNHPPRQCSWTSLYMPIPTYESPQKQKLPSSKFSKNQPRINFKKHSHRPNLHHLQQPRSSKQGFGPKNAFRRS
jgi:hypothetical protein